MYEFRNMFVIHQNIRMRWSYRIFYTWERILWKVHLRGSNRHIQFSVHRVWRRRVRVARLPGLHFVFYIKIIIFKKIQYLFWIIFFVKETTFLLYAHKILLNVRLFFPIFFTFLCVFFFNLCSSYSILQFYLLLLNMTYSI